MVSQGGDSFPDGAQIGMRVEDDRADVDELLGMGLEDLARQ